MLTQPAANDGIDPAKDEMFRRCVSSSKLNEGCVHGEGQTPEVTVFSSSSKKVRVTTGRVSSQSPPGLPSRSVNDPEEARQMLKFDVTPEVLNQRAAYLRPRGSRWSPIPWFHGFVANRAQLPGEQRTSVPT